MHVIIVAGHYLLPCCIYAYLFLHFLALPLFYIDLSCLYLYGTANMIKVQDKYPSEYIETFSTP